MLHIHRAERADALVDALRALLSDPLDDPFAPEVISVPTRGMERWLTQRLSSGLGATPGRADGICANVDFPSPRRLVGNALAAASGIEPDVDPWLPERIVWSLIGVVEECLAEPWLSTLALHLGGPDDPIRQTRRFGSVRHIAELFDRYALHRPEMVAAWNTGDDTDSTGRALPAATRWQAELWRRLRARIEEPDPAARLEAATARLSEDQTTVDLPRRLSLFGLTRLPAARLHVLRSLAVHRDVHLFLLHPSPALWEKIAETPGDPIVRRKDDWSAAIPGNRLLASWGHDARELQLVVGSSDHADHHHPVKGGTSTLLARVQKDVRADALAAPKSLDASDSSIQVHACHGRARQVEVLRDTILHLLADDPTLEPRDVIVMCPDIETFAPLIQATFGAGEVSEDEDDDLDALPADLRPPDLRVKLADRALRQTNPILAVVDRLIDLAGQRLTASEVLDLADREPVRRRFRLDDDDLTRIEEWVADSGIRWGLDAAHREPFKLGALAAGTWRFGLDRVLLGVTMSEDEQRLFGGVLPLDDVDSGAIDLAGRMAELIDRLQTALDSLNRSQPIDAWAAAIGEAADSLAVTTAWDEWQRTELQRLLDDVVREATVDGAVNPVQLALPEIRALLADRLAGRPTRANFRTGALTICTLVPMRSVPHRVVCLLGLDDTVFPRKTPRDGDDLILDDPHVGDRDSRTEDRQMLLDALMAATDKLIITYTGNDERTNEPRPPAVPVGELLDVLERTAPGSADQVVTRHPLQPFDPRNFAAGELGREGPWSFDRVTLAGARALAGGRAEPQPFLSEPLPADPRQVVEVDQLVRFVQHPVRAFLRQRLGMSVGDFSEDIDDALPVELDKLQEWKIGQQLLDARLAGTDMKTAVQAEIARGSLPPGDLARPVISRVSPLVKTIVAHAEALPESAHRSGSLDVRLPLPGDRWLSGTVPGATGDQLRLITFSRVNARHRLAMWVRLVALTVAHPQRQFEALTLGRVMSDARDRASVTIARLPPLEPDEAAAHLEVLIDLYDRGMREPLPMACDASAAYAAAGAKDPVAAGRAAWESAWNFEKEDRQLEHQLVYGGVVAFDELLAEEPRADEVWEAFSDPTRFGRYARRLWAPLLAHEVIEHR